MKTNIQRKVAVVTLGIMAASTVGGMTAAQASSKGRLNTTLAAGAITAYGLLKGNKTVAIAGALGTAYAYSKYNSAKKDEKRAAQFDRQRNARQYQQRYGNIRPNRYTIR